MHTAAASLACGDSLHDIQRQPLLHTVAARRSLGLLSKAAVDCGGRLKVAQFAALLAKVAHLPPPPTPAFQQVNRADEHPGVVRELVSCNPM